MKTLKLLLLVFFTNFLVANAQIGYQVSLLDSATGEPRANETVSCTVTLSGQKSTIFTGTQNVTSNEFGVLSLTVGNADMFNNLDWASELPLFVEVSVDGKSIGKSQVLSVPVAEYAKKTGLLTYENIGSKKYITGDDVYDGECFDYRKYDFFPNHQFQYQYISFWEPRTYYGEYYIEGNMVIAIWSSGDGIDSIILGIYSSETDTIYFKR